MDTTEIYKAVFETSPDGILITNQLGEIILVNKKVGKLFGYEIEELIGQKVEFLIPYRFQQEHIIHYEKFHSNSEVREMGTGRELFAKRKDNSEFYVDVNLNPIASGNEKIICATIRDVTERVQREKILKENQRLVQRIYDASQDAVIISDDIGNITKWDSKSEILFGWKESEVIGLKLSSIIIPERNRKNHDRGMTYYKESQENSMLNRTIDAKVLHKSGVEFDVSLSIIPSFFDSKTHFIGFIRDISERKKSEAVIIEKEERYRILVENAPEALVVVDMETQKFVNVSNSAIELFKTSKEQLLNFGPVDISPEYQPDGTLSSVKAMEKINEAIQGGKPSFEWTHCDSFGNLILCEVHLVRLTEGDKILIRGSIQDITERKKIEAALRVSENKYRDIFNNIQDVFFQTSIDGIIIEISPSINQFAGFTRENMIGTNILDIYYNPADRVRLLTELLRDGCLKDYELRAIDKDNQIVYLSVNARLILDVEGKPVYMDGSIRNVTERKIYDFEIENQNKKLKLQNKELEQFTYVISHDLQEPLRTLLSFSSLFQEEFKGVFNESADIYLYYIQNSSKRMQELVNGLLDYARIGKERELTTINCNEILNETLVDMTFSITENDVKVKVGDLPVIFGYSIELRLLFQNLISNAIKFRRKDIQSEINIDAFQEERRWIFSVKDNGIGIDDKDQEKIFTIFKRLHNRDDYEGTGIGLSHCKKIVDLHGGNLWVDSELGRGSVFNFSIPIL